MFKTRADLKLMAKDQLRGNWGIVIGTTLLIGLAMGAVSGLTSLIFLSILSFLITIPLSFGLAVFYKKLTEGQITPLGEAFSVGFNRYGQVLCTYLLMGLFAFLWSLLFIIPGIIKAYSYSMAPYLIIDNPNMTATEAINKSKELMIGKKFDLWVLQLSFIGWALLAALTIGIGYIWLVPYMETTQYNFFNNVLEVKSKVENS